MKNDSLFPSHLHCPLCGMTTTFELSFKCALSTTRKYTIFFDPSFLDCDIFLSSRFEGRGIVKAFSAARMVMERSPHSVLVGEVRLRTFEMRNT